MAGHDKPIGEISSVTALLVEVFMRFRPRKPLIPFQMKPTSCVLLISIFISTSVHVSGNYVPIIRRTYCIYATLVFFTLRGWLSGRLVGMRFCTFYCTSWTRQPPIHGKKYQYRIDTVSSADDGHIVA